MNGMMVRAGRVTLRHVDPPLQTRRAVGSGGSSTAFAMGLSPAPVAGGPLVRQVSPDKNVNSRCTPGSFTVSPEPEDFAIWCWLVPGTRPRMTFLSVRSQFCLGLPSDPISRRRPCLWLVVAIITSYDVGSPTGDFHPISSRPCRAYTRRFRGPKARRCCPSGLASRYRRDYF